MAEMCDEGARPAENRSKTIIISGASLSAHGMMCDIISTKWMALP